MAHPADDPRTFIAQTSLVGRGGGAVKALAGFKKSIHTVPDAVNPATQAFLGKLCSAELTAEAESFFQRARALLAYKRKDLSLDVTMPVAVLTSKDFTLELAYALDDADPAAYIVTRTLHSLRSGDLVQLPAFDELFAAQFTAIVFTLKKGVRVEAVVDAVEALEPDEGEDAADLLKVDYPSDCRNCTLTIAGVDAAVVCDGSSLEMTFPRSGSPRELIEAFARVRRAFALTKDRALSGLLG